MPGVPGRPAESVTSLSVAKLMFEMKLVASLESVPPLIVVVPPKGDPSVTFEPPVAEMIPVNSDAKAPLFEGSELAVTFLRTAVGPNARPGLEIIRLVEKADSQGLAMVRERAPFAPMPSDGQIRFADQVVLIRSPLRVTFSYAGPDQVWQPDWRGQMELPNMIRVTVRDSATGQVLAVSRAATVHVNASAECARSKNLTTCTTATPVAGKKEEQL